MLTAPLRELTKKNTTCEWETEHRKAFEKLTKALSSAHFMAYFDTATGMPDNKSRVFND